MANINILVVGDWVVDESWIVSTVSSATSSHVGKQQYVSKIKNINSQILSLCSAGSVARLLHSAKRDDDSGALEVQIFGLGYWDPEDTRYLASLFRSDCSIHCQTPQTLLGMHEIIPDTNFGTNSLCHKTNGMCFDCTTPCLRLKTLAAPNTGTIRVVRVYQQTGSQSPQLLHRYDWEPKPFKHESSKLLSHKLNEYFTGWADIIKQNKHANKAIDAVVIVDHNKGCITDGLIIELAKSELLQEARWYARIKDPNAPWIHNLKDKLTLLTSGPELLDEDTGPWFLGKHLSLSAIKWLYHKSRCETVSELRVNSHISAPKYAVVVLHHDNSMAAIVPGNKLREATLYHTIKHPNSPKYTVSRTSVFFSSLIALMEGISSVNSNHELTDTQLERSLMHAYAWCLENQEVINQEPYRASDDPALLDFRRNYSMALIKSKQKGEFRIINNTLLKEFVAWNNAYNSTKYGCISGGSNLVPKEKIQLWRAWSPIRGHISVFESNRSEILKLIQAVRKFNNEREQSRSLCIMIQGNPGSGKSYLVKSLASSLDMKFIEFNITSLASIDDLMACFDTISSVQTYNPNKHILVFWDEINAQINNNQSVYSYFLSPIWDGTYRRNGQSFQLRPCVWVFASTDREVQRFDYNKFSKYEDFYSRINGPTITLLDSDGKRDELEQIYLSIALIIKKYPNVMQISKNVLQYITLLKPKYGGRSLEFIISQFANVSGDKLGASSIPDLQQVSGWINNETDDQELSKTMKNLQSTEDEYVRIYSEPKIF